METQTIIAPRFDRTTFAYYSADEFRAGMESTGMELFNWRYAIERTLDGIVRLTMPVTSSECFVCGEAHKCMDEWGNVDAEEFHTLYLMLDQGRQTQEQLASELYYVATSLNPEFTDPELSDMIQCAKARFGLWESETEIDTPCDAYSDDELSEAVSDFLKYGFDNAIPDTYRVIWDGDSGTVSVWEI